MVLNARQSDILELLDRDQRVSVRKLAATFFVSEMTIRRDLREMERSGYLRRYNGGAVRAGSEALLPFSSRRLLEADEKAALVRHTRAYLADGQSVFLDSSSTCTYLVPLLAEFRDVRIVTNSIPTALAAGEHHIPCILAGGDCFERDLCTVGSAAEEFLRNLNVDVGFFSALGISDDGVISDSDPLQNAVRKAMLPNAAKRIFLFARAKQHKTYLYTLCRREDADAVILI